MAAHLAIESPRVRADIVEASEFPALAQRYNVYAVPKVIINDAYEFVGALPEPQFVGAMVYAVAGGEAPTVEPAAEGESTPLEP